MDSGFQVLDSSFCHWNLDSGFQFLVGFRIPWPVFRIPKPRIPDSTNKFLSDYGFRIPQAKVSQIRESGFPYMGKNKLMWFGGNEIISHHGFPEKCHHSDCKVLHNSSIHFYFPAKEKTCPRYSGRGEGWEGSTLYDGLYEVCERVGISLVEVHKRVGTSVIWVRERAQKG